MTVAYNFSKINNRDKRLYSFQDITLSRQGIPIKLIGMASALLAVSLVINIPICLALDNWYFIPFQEDGIELTGFLLVVGIPIGIAALLYYIKIANYRLIDYLILFLRPRPEMNIKGEKINYSEVRIDAFLERQ